MEKPDKHTVAQALATAFGTNALPTSTPFEAMDYSKTQVYESDKHGLIHVIGIDGAWTLHVEFAQDGTGDIECYGAGTVLKREVVDKITQANTTLDGFLVSGMRMFCLNPDYDGEDRDRVRKLADKVEAVQGRPKQTQA